MNVQRTLIAFFLVFEKLKVIKIEFSKSFGAKKLLSEKILVIRICLPHRQFCLRHFVVSSALTKIEVLPAKTFLRDFFF